MSSSFYKVPASDGVAYQQLVDDATAAATGLMAADGTEPHTKGGPPTTGDMQTVSGVITADQIKLLHASPVVLLPEQGPGKVIVPISFAAKYKFGTIGYGSGGSLLLGYLGQYGQVVIGSAMAQSALGLFKNGYTATSILGNINMTAQSPENLPVTLFNQNTSEFTQGDGILEWSMDYRVVQF